MGALWLQDRPIENQPIRLQVFESNQIERFNIMVYLLQCPGWQGHERT